MVAAAVSAGGAAGRGGMHRGAMAARGSSGALATAEALQLSGPLGPARRPLFPDRRIH